LTVRAGVDTTFREGFLYNLCAPFEAGFAVRFSAQYFPVATWLPEEVLFGAPPAGCGHRFEGVFDAHVRLSNPASDNELSLLRRCSCTDRWICCRSVAQPSQTELLEPVDPQGVVGRIYGGMLASG